MSLYHLFRGSSASDLLLILCVVDRWRQFSDSLSIGTSFMITVQVGISVVFPAPDIAQLVDGLGMTLDIWI